MGKRVRKIAETAHGWRDTKPDLTTGEHDTLVAMIELAWRDVQIDLATVPLSRQEEALAARISAWEWFTKTPEAYKAKGANPPRISFRAACLHLGLHEESTRWACLNRAWRSPHERLPEQAQAPRGTMPDEWREAFFGPDEPERHREDRPYVKRKALGPPPKPEITADDAPVPSLPLPTPPEPLQPVVPAEPPVPPAPVAPAAPAPVQEYCPVLDDAPERFTLRDLVEGLQLPMPAVHDALSGWEKVLEGDDQRTK